MTTKDIADYIGTPDRTVQRWAKDAGAKMASISAKLAVASPRHPSDWTLEETCAIIAVGMGDNAAAMYRLNAARTVVDPTSMLTEIKGAIEALAQPKGVNVTTRRAPLPNGAQLREVRLLWEKGSITKEQVADVLGVARVEIQARSLARVVDDRPSAQESEAAIKEMVSILDDLKGRVGRTSAAVTQKLVEKAQGKLEVVASNYRLNFDGGKS